MKFLRKSDEWVIVLLIVSLAIFAIAIVPVLVIWSLNTLFPVLDIALNWYTWLAMAILLVFLVPNVRITKS
jgi:hypothetical protein